MNPVADAIAARTIGGRLWIYANYHCNLTCSYCLTESGPKVTRRMLTPRRLTELACEARETGFTALGVTGGNPS